MSATGTILSLRRGLLALRPTPGVSSTSLVAGHVLRLEQTGQRAAVLCWRGGLCFAALPPGSSPPPPEHALVGSAAVREHDAALTLPVGDGLGGRIIDCGGAPLDGGAPLAEATPWPAGRSP